MKIRPVRAELFHLDGRTDRQTGGQRRGGGYLTKQIVALRNYANEPKKAERKYGNAWRITCAHIDTHFSWILYPTQKRPDRPRRNGTSNNGDSENRDCTVLFTEFNYGWQVCQIIKKKLSFVMMGEHSCVRKHSKGHTRHYGGPQVASH